MSHQQTARDALEKQGFRFTHSLGQNFLLNDQVIRDIADAAQVRAGDNILEVGPGAGVLTAEMLDRGAKVLALEVDKTLKDVLRQVAPGAKVVFEDVLKADLKTLVRETFGSETFRVVANLPYYITADFLTLMCKGVPTPVDITVMVQKEAAERVMAHPGEKAYCLLAATVQYFGEPSALLEVPPEAFTPRPHVDSLLMRIERHPAPPVSVSDEVLFRQVLAACFAMRRKILANNLCAAFSLSREEAISVIRAAGLDEKIRGETLTLAETEKVAEAISAQNSEK